MEPIYCQTAPPQQYELLSILAAFTETLIEQDRFMQLVGKERLMQSSVLNSLVQEEVEERVGKIKAILEAEQERQRERERERERELLQTLVDAVTTRFPQAPLSLIHDIWWIDQPAIFHKLILDVIRAKDLQEFEQLLKAYATGKGEDRPEPA